MQSIWTVSFFFVTVAAERETWTPPLQNFSYGHEESRTGLISTQSLLSKSHVWNALVFHILWPCQVRIDRSLKTAGLRGQNSRSLVLCPSLDPVGFYPFCGIFCELFCEVKLTSFLNICRYIFVKLLIFGMKRHSVEKSY